MESHESPTQSSVTESSWRPPLKRKREQNLQHAAKKTQCVIALNKPDEPLPSIERESYLEQDIAFEEDYSCDELGSTSIFIDEGVLVGFWFADPSGNGSRPVYCLVKRDVDFAYRKGKRFICVRYIDFDPLDEFGDWRGDDTEDEDAMCPDDVKMWARMMWVSRVYAGIQDTVLED
jgi:hypothetical protein